MTCMKLPLIISLRMSRQGDNFHRMHKALKTSGCKDVQVVAKVPPERS